MFPVWFTFRPATQQDIYSPKHLYGFCYSGTTLAHDTSIAADAAYPVLPTLTVFSVTFTLIDELSKLGAALVILDLTRREACDDVIAVGQQQPDEPDDER